MTLWNIISTNFKHDQQIYLHLLLPLPKLWHLTTLSTSPLKSRDNNSFLWNSDLSHYLSWRFAPFRKPEFHKIVIESAKPTFFFFFSPTHNGGNRYRHLDTSAQCGRSYKIFLLVWRENRFWFFNKTNGSHQSFSSTESARKQIIVLYKSDQ